MQRVKAANLASYSIKDLTAGRELEACAFDAQTYENPDPTQEAYARHVLAGAKAIVVIPRYPLEPGHQYQVTVVAGTQYQWGFGVQETADQGVADKAAPQPAW